MILPIKHMKGLKLIRQWKQNGINKDNIHKNSKTIYHAYKVADKCILNNNAAFKDETLYKGPFEIMQCWANGMVILQCGEIQFRCNIRRIKPYTSDTNAEDIIIKTDVWRYYVRIYQVYTSGYIY